MKLVKTLVFPLKHISEISNSGIPQFSELLPSKIPGFKIKILIHGLSHLFHSTHRHKK